MSLGVHFALKRDEAEHLLAIDDPDALVDFITEELDSDAPLGLWKLGASDWE